MSNFKHLSFSTDEHDIIWLMLNVADESANVLSPDVLDEISEAVTEIANKDPKGLIIGSAKSSGFIAGADIKVFEGIDDPSLAQQFIDKGHQTLQQIEDLKFPTVARVKGFCLGGGLELALACDYIVCDKSSSTKLSLPEVKLGIHPGFGGTVRLPKRIGILKAMPLMLSGKNVYPYPAAKMGMVDLAVPFRQLDNSCVQTILRKPTKKTAPKSARLLETKFIRPLIAKRMRAEVAKKAKQEHYPAPYALIDVWEEYGVNDPKMYESEGKSVAKLVTTPTAQNLVRVFLLQNQLKSEADKSIFSPKHVHVIGGGVMGGDIAAWCAMHGMRVTIQDLKTEAIAKVMQRATSGFKKRYRRDWQRINEAEDNLQADIEGLGIKKADVIIEAIFENLEVKQKVFKNIEENARPGAIIATNTSSIELAKIAEVLKEPERLIGLHFFNPVFKMPLLEIVYSEGLTDKNIIELGKSFGAHINKLPLVVKSSPGFLINRILVPYLLEAMVINQEGVPAEVIDTAATDYGMPMGPLELADTVGLDICMHVGETISETIGEIVPEFIIKKVDAGDLGRKSGQGFYTWKAGKKVDEAKTEWEGDVQAIQDRLIDKILHESEKCLNEGIVTSEELLDAGVIFGTGFAPFRGGPMNAIKDKT